MDPKCLVVLVQLRQDGADVEVRPSHGDVVRLQRDFDLQGLAQVAQRRVELAHLRDNLKRVQRRDKKR